MLLMIPTRLEQRPFIYSKLQSVRVKREARMRARGKSCPQTAPCPLVTVQQGHAVDFQPMSFPVFAHAGIHGVCVCVLVYGCETGARFLRWQIFHSGHVGKHQGGIKETECFPLRQGRKGTWNDSGSLDWDCLQLANLCKLISWLMWKERERVPLLGKQSTSSSEKVKLLLSALVVWKV